MNRSEGDRQHRDLLLTEINATIQPDGSHRRSPVTPGSYPTGGRPQEVETPIDGVRLLRDLSSRLSTISAHLGTCEAVLQSARMPFDCASSLRGMIGAAGEQLSSVGEMVRQLRSLEESRPAPLLLRCNAVIEQQIDAFADRLASADIAVESNLASTENVQFHGSVPVTILTDAISTLIGFLEAQPGRGRRIRVETAIRNGKVEITLGAKADRRESLASDSGLPTGFDTLAVEPPADWRSTNRLASLPRPNRGGWEVRVALTPEGEPKCVVLVHAENYAVI